MKIAVLAMVLLLTGCDLYNDSYYGNMANNHDLFYGDFSEIQDISGISAYIRKYVTPKPDIEDLWSNPSITLSRGYGDCEDLAILYLNIAYVRFGIKGSILLIDILDMSSLPSNYANKSIISGGFTDHAVIEIEGKVFAPITGNFCGFYDEILNDVGFRYNFNEIFN